MLLGDHAYTRVIRGLKVVLPLLALVLLSTMFMISRTTDPTAAIALSDRAFRDRIDNQQLTGPQYAGNTSSGQPLTVTAEAARPDPEVDGKTYGQEVNALIRLENGEDMTITADTGVVDEASDTVILSGDVNIVTTDGYNMRTSQLTTRISQIQGESAGAVTGFGPPGTLDAGKMAVRSDPESGNVHLLFTQGVHLVYTKRNSD